MTVVHAVSLPTQSPSISALFFFNDTATTEIYTLSLHDALPISTSSTSLSGKLSAQMDANGNQVEYNGHLLYAYSDRKSTRLNSSHLVISYAVFCLKKKKT